MVKQFGLEIINNKKNMNKLIDAANKYEDKEYYVVDGNYTTDAVVNAFLSGANWQNNNMWNLANNLPETNNGRTLCEVIVLGFDYRTHIALNTDVENLFKSGNIIAWMYVPVFNAENYLNP